MSELLDRALKYASRGWPVFPCDGKRPLVDRGLLDATTERATVEQWWSRWPQANVAIRTGGPSGLVVLDVDGDEGHDALRRLERQHGELPTTASVKTPRGGSHFYFCHRGDLRNSAGQLGAGLDIRADGGYVVAPPSVGPGGRRYEPDEQSPVADMPPWLAGIAANGRRNGSAPPLPERIGQGQRNAALTSLAGSMRRRGASQEAIQAALESENQRCDPPLDADELEAIARSVSRYEPADSFRSPKGSDANETNKGLPFASLTDALADAPPEPAWLWRGYLAPGSITLLAGRPKVGKSTLAFALLGALGEGRSFLDLATVQSGVLLLSEEREGTLAEKHRRFGLNGSIDLLMRHQAQGTSWGQVVDQSVARCRQRGFGLLVIDTFDKWTGLRGDDENKAGAVLQALDPLIAAAGHGLAVLIVTHQRKASGSHGEAIRGSNALAGGVDVILELERVQGEARGVRVLRSVSRYEGTPDELAAELEEGDYSSRGELADYEASTQREAVLEAVVAGCERPEEAAEHSGLKPGMARKRLAELYEAGTVRRLGAGRKGDPHRYLPLEVP